MYSTLQGGRSWKIMLKVCEIEGEKEMASVAICVFSFVIRFRRVFAVAATWFD